MCVLMTLKTNHQPEFLLMEFFYKLPLFMIDLHVNLIKLVVKLLKCAELQLLDID